jgi:hypothetical protein
MDHLSAFATTWRGAGLGQWSWIASESSVLAGIGALRLAWLENSTEEDQTTLTQLTDHES